MKERVDNSLLAYCQTCRIRKNNYINMYPFEFSQVSANLGVQIQPLPVCDSLCFMFHLTKHLPLNKSCDFLYIFSF